MRKNRFVAVLLAGANIFQAAGASFAADSSGLPPLDSFLRPLPGTTLPAPEAQSRAVGEDYPTPRADVLVIGGGRRDAKTHPEISLAVSAFEAHGAPVYYWETKASPKIVGLVDVVAIAGDASEADQALKAVIGKALKEKFDPRNPVTVCLPLDALYKDGQTLKQFLPHPRKFYEAVIRSWVNSDPQFAAGRGLRIGMAVQGDFLYDVAVARGKDFVVVKLDLTEMSRIVGYSKRRFRQRVSGKPDLNLSLKSSSDRGVAWPGSSPLLSGESPALRFGRGDREYEGIQGTVIKGRGGMPDYIHGSVRLGNVNDGQGGGRLDVFQDTTYGGTLRRLDASFMISDNETMNHGISMRYQTNANPIASHMLFRGGYINRLDFSVAGGELRNEAMLKLGYLKSEGLYHGVTSDMGTQSLYGAEDTLSFTRTFDWAKLTAETGGRVAYAQAQGEGRQFDNAMLHGGVGVTIPLPRNLNLDLDVTHRTIEYSRKRYFFLGERADNKVAAAISWARQGLSAALLGGISVTKGNQADDVQKKAGVQFGIFDTALTALASHGQVMKQYTVALAHTFAKQYDVEGFVNLQKPSDGSYTELPAQIGLNVRVAFGQSPVKRNRLPDESRYRPEIARGDAYAQRFYKDHHITLEAISGQMDSVRKATEWVGSNVPWITGSPDEWARHPDETYGGRGGDCDEQAWLISGMLNNNPKFRANGGQAYILDYWTNGGGHGVSLVKENGKVFVSQYGQIYQVKVDPNASLEQIATAAMQQVSPYLALKPQNGASYLYYGVWGTQGNDRSPGNMGYFTNQLTPDLSIDNFQATTSRPPVEQGINAKIGDTGF